MIRTFVTPTQTECTIHLHLPNEYVGQEIEIIAFKKEETINTLKIDKKPSDFFGILNNEEADKFEKHTQQIRNEWNGNI